MTQNFYGSNANSGFREYLTSSMSNMFALDLSNCSVIECINKMCEIKSRSQTLNPHKIETQIICVRFREDLRFADFLPSPLVTLIPFGIKRERHATASREQRASIFADTIAHKRSRRDGRRA